MYTANHETAAKIIVMKLANFIEILQKTNERYAKEEKLDFNNVVWEKCNRCHTQLLVFVLVEACVKCHSLLLDS